MEVHSSDGPMVLLEVGSIFARKNQSAGPDFFVFHGNGWQMAATRYHAFLAVRNGERCVLTTDQLEPSDKIWVDQSAFQADGSLTQRQTSQAAW